MEKGMLYDCLVTYHLVSGQIIMESYRQDVPNELWDELTHEYTECGEYLELQPSETYAKALLPKSNISYITLKVLPRHD